VTPDGRRVVSASADKTLKVWNLESGRALATLEGHASYVNGCAVTSDGHRVVSASWDKTLKVWDLEAGACLFTHRANTNYATVTATATTIIGGAAAGSVWFLGWPSPSLREKPLGSGHGPGHQLSPSTDTASPSPRPPMKHTILFLAANPLDTDRRALDEECAAIRARAPHDVGPR
jgi:WD40 repeat protein